MTFLSFLAGFVVGGIVGFVFFALVFSGGCAECLENMRKYYEDKYDISRSSGISH